MPSKWHRSLAASLTALFLVPASLGAYDYPLSDTAVRSAYFLGQRHDISMALFLDRYTKHLPFPKFGPYISSVTFFTPFAQLVEYSDHYQGNLSAQQAEIAHRQSDDKVIVVIELQLTPTYGPYVSTDGKTQVPTEFGSIHRSSDFWREFNIAVQDNNTPLDPSYFSGHPRYFCNDGGNCILGGATVKFVFSADSFSSDSAHVQVTPPEGEPVQVEFSLISLR